VGYFEGGLSDPPPEKQIPFGSAQGRPSHQKKGARNDRAGIRRNLLCIGLARAIINSKLVPIG